MLVETVAYYAESVTSSHIIVISQRIKRVQYFRCHGCQSVCLLRTEEEHCRYLFQGPTSVLCQAATSRICLSGQE